MSREAEIWKEGLRTLLRQARDDADIDLPADSWEDGYLEGKRQGFEAVLQWLDEVD